MLSHWLIDVDAFAAPESLLLFQRDLPLDPKSLTLILLVRFTLIDVQFVSCISLNLNFNDVLFCHFQYKILSKRVRE